MGERLGRSMTGSEIRGAFLEFFRQRGHAIVPSSSLVPHGDPTLLFTNAGMVQFKDLFLGVEKRSYTRAATAQKCVRAGGKHNDLDNVGFTARHHTFFEMLGNFSFGDYFKEEAITFAWEFLTKVLELPPERLWITVYKEDDQAVDLWKRIAGVPEHRIVRLGEHENFWAMGDTGPCGPCSEIVVDRGETHACGPDCGLGKCDCDRWLEIWNLVFTQFDRQKDGTLVPLAKPNIDTGMGLERISSVLQGVDTNFDTDLFVPIIKRIEEIAGKRAGDGVPVFPYRVIADHIRACVFLAADGVQPSNEGRGYVMRRILRRAVRFGRVLGIQDPFLAQLVPVVGQVMRDAYPEVQQKREYIESLLTQDEVRFLRTLAEGEKRAQELIAETKASGREAVSGRDAFVLYDTFGFPIDLTKDMAREQGLSVGESDFEKAMEEQRSRSKGKLGLSGQTTVSPDLVSDLAKTRFVGYDSLVAVTKVAAIIKDGARSTELENGEEALVVLESTPFYAAGGGQESDSGTLELLSPGVQNVIGGTPVAKVVGVDRGPGGIHLHRVRATAEGIMVGQTVISRVDERRRQGLQQHHTATHLIHKALQSVLGEHAQQAGSLVQGDRLRFDFAHFRALTPEELRRVEDLVNDIVMADLPVTWSEMPLEEARKQGAMALFGEKYGETVRVVDVQGYSKELCGGTHVARTGQIGQVRILSETAVAAGVRRVEAVAGRAALDAARDDSRTLAELAAMLGSGAGEIIAKVKSLLDTVTELQNEVAKARRGQLDDLAKSLVAKAVVVPTGNRSIVVSRHDGMEVQELRSLGDRLKSEGVSVSILGTASSGRCTIVVMVDQECASAGVDAAAIAKKGASLIGGSGGGKPTLAQAGGKDCDKLDQALLAAESEARRLLSGAPGIAM